MTDRMFEYEVFSRDRKWMNRVMTVAQAELFLRNAPSGVSLRCINLHWVLVGIMYPAPVRRSAMIPNTPEPPVKHPPRAWFLVSDNYF